MLRSVDKQILSFSHTHFKKKVLFDLYLPMLEKEEKEKFSRFFFFKSSVSLA